MDRGVIERNRLARIALFANRQVERNLAQKRVIQFFRGFARSAVAKDFFTMAALAAYVVAHVFHDAENGHIQLLEHGDGF